MAHKLLGEFVSNYASVLEITNRFHVAERLFSKLNGSQIMAKCDDDQKVAHEPVGECVAHVLTTF